MENQYNEYADTRKLEKDHLHGELQRIFLKYVILLSFFTIIYGIALTYNFTFINTIHAPWFCGACIAVVILIIYFEYWNTRYRLSYSNNRSYRLFWRTNKESQGIYQRMLRLTRNDIEENNTALNIYKSFSPVSMLSVIFSLFMNYQNHEWAIFLICGTSILTLFVLHKLFSTFIKIKCLHDVEETFLQLLELITQNNSEEAE